MMNTPDPRVLHVIYNLEYGGAQEVLCILAEMHGDSIENFLVCAFEDGPMRARLEAAGAVVTVIGGPRCGYKSVLRYVTEIVRIGSGIAAVAEANRAHIIQTHALGILDIAVMRLRRTLRDSAILWTFHGDFLPVNPGPALWARRSACRWMYRAAAGSVDAIVCVSNDLHDVARSELGYRNSMIRMIPNAPSDRKFLGRRSAEEARAQLGLASDSPSVVFLGRLASVKGCDYLIRSAPLVFADIPNAVFLIAGEGPELGRLMALADHGSIRGRIRFLGARADTAELLTAADVFCLPSRSEGMSLALLEAMAAGKPVVVSDLAANREVVEHGHTGMLIRPGDVNGLAATLIHLLRDREAANAMGGAARDHARAKYSAAAQFEAYRTLYQEIFASRTRR